MNETSPPISDLVFATIKRWRQGERPDAEAVLQSHPEVRDRKALVIDLIYEEYCLRREHGETFVPSTFVSRFPEYRQSLARMLDAHQFMAEAEESPPLDWPPIGGEFLGFEIVEQIGSSAAAKLYLARETEFGGRLVVIKVSRFGRSEARQLGKLAHPGIVPIHSVREDPHTGMTCVCMPFLGTTTLVDVLDESFASGRQPNSARVFGRLARGYLPAGVDAASWGPVDRFFDSATYEEGVIYVGSQILAALAAAHQAGIVHLDIKPSNVLLARDGRPMLMDFNLAADRSTPVERLGGTLPYMAPERLESLALPQPKTSPVLDPRSDLYSVGVMLFELLTGQLPNRPLVTAEQRQPTLAQWLECRQRPSPSARLRNPLVEPALDEILTRTLAPSVDDRYTSATELSDALGRLIRPSARLVRRLRRNRRDILAAGASAIAIVVAGFTYWLSLPPLEHVRNQSNGWALTYVVMPLLALVVCGLTARAIHLAVCSPRFRRGFAAFRILIEEFVHHGPLIVLAGTIGIAAFDVFTALPKWLGFICGVFVYLSVTLAAYSSVEQYD